MIFIGDVHGKWKEYIDLISRYPASIQVGDFALGFPHKTDEDMAELEVAIACGDHKMIGGNHDNPHVCRTHPFCINSGTIKDNMMFIGGAMSIDRHMRIENRDWWKEEEHSYPELCDFITVYEEAKPEIMVTHDAPNAIAAHLFRFSQYDTMKSITRQSFDTMFQIHKPKYWIFGHYHQSKRMNILGTEFICLNELETVEI